MFWLEQASGEKMDGRLISDFCQYWKDNSSTWCMGLFFDRSIIGTPYRTSPQVKFLNRAPPSFIISTQQSTSEFDNTHTSGEYMYLSLQRCWGFLDCCSCRKNVYIPKTQNTENCQARFQSQLVSYQNHMSMFLKSASFTEGRRCPKQLLVNSYFNCGDRSIFQV